MLAIEKRGVAGVVSAPNPRVFEPAAAATTQQRRKNFEIFTEADLTELPGQHKCAPRFTLPGPFPGGDIIREFCYNTAIKGFGALFFCNSRPFGARVAHC